MSDVRVRRDEVLVESNARADKSRVGASATAL